MKVFMACLTVTQTARLFVWHNLNEISVASAPWCTLVTCTVIQTVLFPYRNGSLNVNYSVIADNSYIPSIVATGQGLASGSKNISIFNQPAAITSMTVSGVEGKNSSQHTKYMHISSIYKQVQSETCFSFKTRNLVTDIKS